MVKKVKFPTVPKRGKRDKEKASSRSEPAPSPLHEDEPSSRSGSRALRDKQREEQRKERDERRKQRDQRLEESKASKKASKKKKSKPKLSQEEQDLQDAKLGCCHKFAQFLAKVVHLIDGIIGLIFVIYGSLILTNFETPAMEAVYTTLTYGATLLFTSVMGVVGFYSSKCNRCGLAISAYAAPFIAIFYIVIIIALLASPDALFDYLTEHKDVLYLTDEEIQTIRNLLPVFYIVLACLAAIEIVRFLGVRKLRHRLVRYDDASERIYSSRRSDRGGSLRSSQGSLRSSERSSGSKGSKRSKASSRSSKRSKQDTALTEPLIDEEMGGRDASSDEDSDW